MENLLQVLLCIFPFAVGIAFLVVFVNVKKIKKNNKIRIMVKYFSDHSLALTPEKNSSECVKEAIDTVDDKYVIDKRFTEGPCGCYEQK